MPCSARWSTGAERGMFCAFAACPIEMYLWILNQQGLVEKEIRVDPCWVFNDRVITGLVSTT